jgi:hypothetical protein
MATFNVDIHSIRMNELVITHRAGVNGAWWITLEFGTRDALTLFFATEADFLEMKKRLCPEPSVEPDPLEMEIPF